ncbi:C-type lectin domain family 4 member G [Holothuria leucospilota]|uniref:C-type lectin domain family 4 member G n=1 Tax=Holothuria leucospilota TaxID=206669 RepID=A0A9Q1C9F3_HOLLE|nr:C-type lectin domain family 4 member G [Holothuria leucospilota]
MVTIPRPVVWVWCLLYWSIALGFEPVVQWQAEQVTIYGGEKTAEICLEVAKPRGRDVTVGLLSYGVGLSVSDDVVIPETTKIPAGKYVGSMNVTLNDDAAQGTSENGYRKVRIRLNEIVKGKAILGGYGFREIMDVNILGHATPGTGCHSGSFRTSRVIVNEGDGTATLTFIVNQPFKEDLELPYRVDLEWTGTTSHAIRGQDFIYRVDYHGQDDFKHVILRAGETSVDITIRIIDDEKPEDTEQFLVQLDHSCLSPLINILSDSVIVDIVDNDRCLDPADALYYDGSCYFKVFLPGKPILSAREAEEMCNEKNGYLAIIKNEVENTIVSEAGDVQQAWIGVIRNPNNTDEFIWQDGSALTFDCWRQREPNNRLGDENCVKINYVRLGFWNDTPCKNEKTVHYGVCEKPAQSGSG